jgi:hypothetical protein
MKKPLEISKGFSFLVPRAGIEPAHPKVQDFESSASTSSATEAFIVAVRLTAALTIVSGCKNKELFQFSKHLRKN